MRGKMRAFIKSIPAAGSVVILQPVKGLPLRNAVYQEFPVIVLLMGYFKREKPISVVNTEIKHAFKVGGYGAQHGSRLKSKFFTGSGKGGQCLF